jgi:hypothetical protein
MEPRAYSPAPRGTQFVLLSYGHQSGDVLLDSSLPLKDVSISLNAASFGYGRTFNFAGRQANVAVLVPRKLTPRTKADGIFSRCCDLHAAPANVGLG